MNSMAASRTGAALDGSAWLRWWPVIIGLGILYVPTYIDLSRHFWDREDRLHGPIALAAVLWLLWRGRDVLLAASDRVRPVLGSLFIALGLALYVVGRSQEFMQLEAISQVPLAAGLVMALQGASAWRKLWFPILFIVFVVPLPGSLLDAVLLPLKHAVSAIVEDLLHAADYPIARSGVVLTIGTYQLLIADACAGLNSMIALTAVGTFYAYLVGYKSRLHNSLLLASILPVAFLSNVVRVTVLVLVTYHLGDAAGQRFHGYAGMAEVLFAFAAFFMLDNLLTLWLERARGGERA